MSEPKRIGWNRGETLQDRVMRCLDWIRSRSGTFALTIIIASIVSCSTNKLPALPSPDPDKIVLYEGLPRQDYEPERFAEDSKKPTILKGGFPFYQEPLTLKETDAKTLGKMLAHADMFQPFGGEKKCGGFHPDYAIVVWSKGEETTYLICLGCGEAKVSRPDGSQARYDLGRDPAKPSLRAILKPYQKNRPTPIVGPG
jgi:hypothetical protein